MFGFIAQQPLFATLLILFAFQFVRYLLIPGSVFLAVWVLGARRFAGQKIDPEAIRWKDIRREMGWSLLTMAVFQIPGAFVVTMNRSGQTRMYTDIAANGGWAWVFGSLVLLLAIHDLYFYVIHRSMHHPWLFRHFHAVHHRSLSPTPWAAFSFHPLEALLESGIIYIFVFFVPLHAVTIFLFQFASIVMNAYGHLGYDLTPKSWARLPMLKHINTTRQHHWHHRRFDGNYGLYTTVWDRAFGTLKA